MTFEEQVNEFINFPDDVAQLKKLLFERSAELLQCKQFIKVKGLEAEYNALITLAEARSKAKR